MVDVARVERASSTIVIHQTTRLDTFHYINTHLKYQTVYDRCLDKFK